MITTVTTQRTSKSFKAQLVTSDFLFFFSGLSWFLPYGGAYEDGRVCPGRRQ